MEQLWKEFHNCSYRRSLVMQSRGRSEPSVSLVSTPITFHNYRPWDMAITRPPSLQPVHEPIEKGTGWAGVVAHLSGRCLETRRRPRARLLLALKDGRVMESLSGLDESKRLISERLAPS